MMSRVRFSSSARVSLQLNEKSGVKNGSVISTSVSVDNFIFAASAASRTRDKTEFEQKETKGTEFSVSELCSLCLLLLIFSTNHSTILRSKSSPPSRVLPFVDKT